MAQITTVDGTVLNFDESIVEAVADHDAATGDFVTCVYGFADGMKMTSEPVADLLSRLNLTDFFAQLTRPNGDPVWIRGSAVVNLAAPIPGEHDHNVRSVVYLRFLTQAVTETMEQARLLLNASVGLA